MARVPTLTDVASDIQRLRTQVRRLEQPVTSARLARRAVESDNIAPRAVTGSRIGRGAVRSANLASEAVTDSKIASSAITLDKLAPSVVTSITANVTDVAVAAAASAAAAAVAAAVEQQGQREGPQGPEGAVGPAGPRGPEGAVGPAGPQGPEGAVGPAGPQGPEGAVGPAGPQGPEGAVGPAGPRGPTGTRGPAGPQGPAGTSGIVDVRFVGSNASEPFTINQDGSGSGMVELILPPITVALNQVVKLDAFSNVNLLNVQSYSVNSFISRSPEDVIASDNEAVFQNPNQPNFDQATVTTAINWVDSPAPGTYAYTFTIIGSAPFGLTVGSIDSRGFTAMVIAANGNSV